eukprot:13963577-Heterocapsa_arctica.AAC.1
MRRQQIGRNNLTSALLSYQLHRQDGKARANIIDTDDSCDSNRHKYRHKHLDLSEWTSKNITGRLHVRIKEYKANKGDEMWNFKTEGYHIQEMLAQRLTGNEGSQRFRTKSRSDKDGGLHTTGRKNSGDVKGGRSGKGHEEGGKERRRNGGGRDAGGVTTTSDMYEKEGRETAAQGRHPSG